MIYLCCCDFIEQECHNWNVCDEHSPIGVWRSIMQCEDFLHRKCDNVMTVRVIRKLH